MNQLQKRQKATGDCEVFLNRVALDRIVQARMNAAKSNRERREIVLNAMFAEHDLGKPPVWWDE